MPFSHMLSSEEQAAIEARRAIAIAKHSCLVCANYRSVHAETKVSFCMDATKTVFKNTGCSSWLLHRTS